MRVTCEKCVYWESPKADTEKRLGECRRNPPVHEFWPVTLPTDWCGLAVPRLAVHLEKLIQLEAVRNAPDPTSGPEQEVLITEWADLQRQLAEWRETHAAAISAAREEW